MGKEYLSDILESVLGAIYLDSDNQTVKNIINTIFQPLVSDSLLKKDSKSQLQEYLHREENPTSNLYILQIIKKIFQIFSVM